MSFQGGDISKVVDALKSGKDPHAALDGDTGTSSSSNSSMNQGLTDDDLVINSWESTQDSDGDTPATDPSDPTEGQETADTRKDSDSQQKKVSSGSKNIKRIPVDKGKSHIEVNYDDRKAIDDAFLKAHGFRRAYAERDQYQRKYTELETKFKEVNEPYSRLDEAWRTAGIRGVIDLLEGREGAYEAHIQSQVERANFLRKATPEQVEALQAKELAEKQAREVARIRKENEDFRKQVASEREAAETKAMESRVYPVFEKHRFQGKLGDPDDELMFDQMLWNTAMSNLAPYEEQGIDITPELVDKEFSAIARTLRKRISVQADKAASKAVEKKKQEATENVQAKAVSGYRNDSLRSEATKMIANGDTAGFFRNFGKFKGVFS